MLRITDVRETTPDGGAVWTLKLQGRNGVGIVASDSLIVGIRDEVTDEFPRLAEHSSIDEVIFRGVVRSRTRPVETKPFPREHVP